MAEIKEALRTFIVETQCIAEVPMASEPSVTRSGQPYFLQKVGVQRNLVAIATMGGNEGWAFDVVAELSSLVRNAIASKANKLRAVSPPWVLLLLDRHHLATGMEYASVRGQLANPDCDSSTRHQFDSVYIVDAKKDVFRLHPLDDGACIG